MIRALLTAILLVAPLGCARDQWQPYFEPDDDPSGGILPGLTFRELTDCQQYLHLRFGNLRTTGTFYCYRGWRPAASSAVALPTGTDRLGALDCPRSERQIVGQLIVD
jgi:hypothetical protein